MAKAIRFVWFDGEGGSCPVGEDWLYSETPCIEIPDGQLCMMPVGSYLKATEIEYPTSTEPLYY